MNTQKPDAIELNTPYFLETDDSTVRDGKNNVVFEIYDADIGFNEGELRKMLNALNRYDWLEHQVRSLTAERDKYRDAYNELIFAVSHKYESETRHQTALKYIQQAEESSGEACANPDNGADFARQVKAELGAE